MPVHKEKMASEKSVLTKRAYGESFGQHTYEDERYSEDVRDDYFAKGGMGHGVYTSEKTCIQKNIIYLSDKYLKEERNS